MKREIDTKYAEATLKNWLDYMSNYESEEGYISAFFTQSAATGGVEDNSIELSQIWQMYELLRSDPKFILKFNFLIEMCGK